MMFLIVAFLTEWVLAAATTDKPLIGVLGMPAVFSCDSLHRTSRSDAALYSLTNESFCFSSLYERWIWSAGGRAVGIPHNAFDDHLDTLDVLLANLNGFLFTGGGYDLAADTPYKRTATHIYRYVVGRAQSGETVPLHTTCMGFQLLCVLAAGDNVSVLSTGFDSEDLPLPLNFTAASAASPWLRAFPAGLRSALAADPITTNLHHDGVDPSLFTPTAGGPAAAHHAPNPVLSSALRLVSTNADRKGRPFASTVEAPYGHIVGTQWHPERPQFEWNAADGIPKSTVAIEANAWAAMVFLNAARNTSGRDAFGNKAAADAVRRWISYGARRIPMGPVETGYEALMFQP
eukprot:TRINITY_DN44682_c0_g1_i1.p1 TRINITY_DN44682_c0_g1~~TRINITY_DN44682_c0_g1_i1.p1  ORF type:complete len:366 (-),score=56.41 TRINITY_DN44682_c0_g1_i1:340-1380(-)